MTVRFQQNESEIATEAFEDGIVSINFLTGRYFTFNALGEQIWTALAEPLSIDDILAKVDMHGDGATAKRAVEEFVQQLLTERLVATNSPGAVDDPASKLPPVPAGDKNFPQVQVFDDLADLILLDPIHDVSEAMGWPVLPNAG